MGSMAKDPGVVFIEVKGIKVKYIAELTVHYRTVHCRSVY